MKNVNPFSHVDCLKMQPCNFLADGSHKWRSVISNCDSRRNRQKSTCPSEQVPGIYFLRCIARLRNRPAQQGHIRLAFEQDVSCLRIQTDPRPRSVQCIKGIFHADSTVPAGHPADVQLNMIGIMGFVPVPYCAAPDGCLMCPAAAGTVSKSFHCQHCCSCQYQNQQQNQEHFPHDFPFPQPAHPAQLPQQVFPCFRFRTRRRTAPARAAAISSSSSQSTPFIPSSSISSCADEHSDQPDN